MARILVVDDEYAVRLPLRRVLESEGHEVTEAFHGDEALQLFGESLFDLVLLDISCPKEMVSLPSAGCLADSRGQKSSQIEYLGGAGRPGSLSSSIRLPIPGSLQSPPRRSHSDRTCRSRY